VAKKPSEPPPTALAESALLEVGLRPGDRVRFRKKEGGAWQEARVERRERDGSIGVRDGQGAARSIPVERLQVRTTGRRGGVVWEALAERADRDEQLGMF
jgi:anaerobic selenocysteine-containing dehydrogenase